MPAYMIARVLVNDPDEYMKYVAKTSPIVEQCGGRFIVRGGNPTAIEGPESDHRIVVVEFPDRDAANRFYECDEYRAARLIRFAASDGDVILVDGA